MKCSWIAVTTLYHFLTKVISRANEWSAGLSLGLALHDERLDRAHDFSNEVGVVHSEVMLPDGAPKRLSDCEALWNAAEAAEVRKEAQLAREVEFAILSELGQVEGIPMSRAFVQEKSSTAA